MLIKKTLYPAILISLLLHTNLLAQINWLEKESTHFKLIYLEDNSYLSDYILVSAENALQQLMELLEYQPAEKIIINIYDINDYGIGSATTVPENIIRISIEPFEAGYENMLYTERFKWLITHELVHIVLNDKTTDSESIARSLFSKVPPEQNQPSSVIFSLLTNYSRYSPRWYQEGIAVYLETWLNGGFGRTLSNFDEMYFRAYVLENKEFPELINLETIHTHNSFLLETLYYFLGTRFVSYLSITYGPEKLLDWYKSDSDDMYSGIFSRFENKFGKSFEDAWNDFINYEREFQSRNIEKLSKYDFTSVRHLTSEPQGWVSKPNIDKSRENIIFGTHKAHQLAYLQKLNLKTGESEEISSIPTPSIYQVASTAYDKSSGLLFYTTNNNKLFRDIWVYDTVEEDKKLLFENYRIGYLTIADSTHDLWGIEHSNGVASIMFSPYPYEEFFPLLRLNMGEEISQLSVSPSGSYLAAVLHKTDGEQKVILIDTEELLSNSNSTFVSISNEGSPENPSWSPDENILYWNAYTNGVSNIYRKDFSSGKVEVVSHTLSGLFKPVQLSEDSLFVFEFTTEGFIPSIIPNEPAKYLPAIEYMGQKVFTNNPELASWNNSHPDYTFDNSSVREISYNPLHNIDVNSVIPVVSGFQSQVVLGLYGHFADPMHVHDLKIEVGYSPFTDNPSAARYHFSANYNYNTNLSFSFNQNAADFYDLFNKRKRGMIGRKITMGYTHYWKYDYPHKLKQHTELAFYNGVEYINDNLVRVSQPDFMVVQTNLNSQSLRRSIGSSDYESGNIYDFTIRVFGDNPTSPQFAGQIIGEWDNFSNWIMPHNTFHLKLAAGYHHDNPMLVQGRFYFGGFGNRIVENVDVKQFRKVFRFSGIPIYSMDADRFVKVMFENNLPPIRFGNASVGEHFLNHIDMSIYTNVMIANSPLGTTWFNIGAQANFVMKHWFNLESTFSTGIAKAWWDKGNNWEWFLSIKLLKN